jgi:LuxR family maltose regulon positive regulatory protein
VSELILQTKLFIPPLPASIVPRARLYARLDAGLAGKLTLVAAPAGFGKTTLVAGWIAAQEDATRFRWLALDAADNDLPDFSVMWRRRCSRWRMSPCC